MQRTTAASETADRDTYGPLFHRITELTSRADQLVANPPDDIRIQTNMLVRDVIGFCREHPEFRWALPSFASDPSWKPRWEKFIALLGISREVAEQARGAIKSVFGLDSTRPPSERGVLQGLLEQFGNSLRPEEIRIDPKYLPRPEDIPGLHTTLAELRDLRTVLAPHNLQVGIGVGSKWFDPHFNITSAEVTLRSYNPHPRIKLPRLDPLAQTAARPPRRDLPPREIERARLARQAALERAMRNEQSEHAEGAWVPNRDKLLKTIDEIDTFTEDQIAALSTACERFMRRIDLTFRRAIKKKWIAEELVQTLETILESTPERIKRLKAWQTIKERLLAIHAMCDYVTAGYQETDEIDERTYRRLLTYLPEESQKRHERILEANKHSTEHPGNEDNSPDRDDDEEQDLVDLMGRGAAQDNNHEDGGKETTKLPPMEWGYENLLGELEEEEVFSQVKIARYRTRQPRISTIFVSRQIERTLKKGMLTDDLQKTVATEEMDQKSQTAVQLFLLHLAQKLARCQIPDWKAPIRLPLIPGKPTVNFALFRQTIEEEKLPDDLWRQQTEAMIAIKRGMEKGQSKMYVCAPPGTGKTRDAILLMQHLNPKGRTLILVPTVQLMEQTMQAIRKYGKFRDIGKVGGGSAEFDRQVVIATYTSFQKAVLEGNFHPNEFGLVMMDEVHRSLSDLRSRIVDTFREAIVVGMTASDQDIKGQSVSREFACVYRLNAADGMRAGIVNPTKLWRDRCPEDMGTKVREVEAIHKHRLKGERTLVIFNTVERLELAAKCLRDVGIDARCVHSQMDPRQAVANDEEFRASKFPLLLVCDMLLEGWDDPGLRHIIMADLRTATWQFLQATGRNGRKLPGKGHSTLSMLESFDTKSGDHVLKNAFKIDPDAHSDGNLIITPSGQWPDNTILT